MNGSILKNGDAFIVMRIGTIYLRNTGNHLFKYSAIIGIKQKGGDHALFGCDTGKFGLY